ncbi:DNAJ domain-containing protein [Aureobasidium pullulans]|uniref:Tetratricopeptide repeat and J domain-containing co-chaperone DNJ1 n=1 Tax=Aureobasidium pullulans TaxID=5580 RepID=A0A4V4IX71_AURPU|nr:DNAJ domain-containing protein [Aureobasidium pullulans]THZ20474.1 DNAJ domain-containing protein [Aureobasidium pullulans]
MILPLQTLALGAALALSNLPLSHGLSASDIPADIPVSQLISSATAALAQGNGQDALTYYDAAITRDPQNYLTIFRRGAAYLQLGKSSQASHDFDRVLAIKPTFEGALVQRAKIKSRNGDWSGAKSDYETAGKKDGDEIRELLEAQNAAALAHKAEQDGHWSDCTTQADIAVLVAGGAMDLRHTRAKCRFEKGDIVEALSDLLHIAQVSSGSSEHLQISATSFYALNEPVSGMGQVKKCLHSDPDSKPCRKLLKAEKAVDKQLKKVKDAMEKSRYINAVNILVPTKDDDGLLKTVKDSTQQYRDEGLIHKNAPDRLYNDLIELTCEAYTEMNNLKKAQPYCEEALTHNPNCLPALIGKATRQLDADEFEPAIQTLNQAKEHHQNSQKVQELLQKAHTLLKRSKQKDYYKVLGVTRDSEEREIKKAYRKLTILHHPDKAAQKGTSPEEAQKKMAEINEAYEVLSDPELKARFDRGDDPNDQSQQGSPFQGQPFGFPGGGQQQFFHQRPGGGQGFKFQHQGGFQFPGGGFPF